jgi:hypothetical protein
MRIVGLALILLASVTACGSTGNLPFCPTPPQPAFAMVNPSPGATGVSDTLSQIVFSGSGPSQVTLSGGTQTLTLTVTQSVATISTPLQAKTLYTVSYTYTSSGSDCTPQTFTVEPGSFTTQ